MYLYDASGSPIGMMYRTESYAVGTFDIFWFEKNLQGDIVAVYNESGTKIVTYNYFDAWGNHGLTYINGGDTSGAQYNPFRYRGYYYDTDLDMYYLQSRYYDSNTCRFINADGYVSTGQGILGNNMFAYCGNNPVNRTDHTGEAWYHWAMGAASTSNSIQEFNEQGDWETVAATAGGAVLGGVTAYNTVVGAKIPTSMLNQFYLCGVDTNIFRSGTLTVYSEHLEIFNQAVSGTIKFIP